MSQAISKKQTTSVSPLSPVLPSTSGKQRALRWGRLYGASRSLAVLAAAQEHDGPVLVVAPEARRLRSLESELQFFNPDPDLSIQVFPDWESLPYDSFSPHQDIISERLLTLFRLPHLKKGIVIAQASSLMHRLTPPEFVAGHTFILSEGERLELTDFRDQLARAAYRAVSQVMEPGEFAIRGGLIDLFPMGSRRPYRIDLFDEDIESIRVFDPASQRSGERLKQVRLLPAREYPMTEEAIQHFRQAFRVQFEGDPQNVTVYRDVSQGLIPAGTEYYLPLFFDRTATIFDYLPDNTLVILGDALPEAARQFQRDVAERYAERRSDRERPVLNPELLFLEPERFLAEFKHYQCIELLSFKADEVLEKHQDVVLAEAPVISFDSQTPARLPVDYKADSPYDALIQYIESSPNRILLVAETPGRRESLKELLAERGHYPKILSGWMEFLSGSDKLAMTVAPLDRGLTLTDPAVAIITETQLYGERAAQRRRRSLASREPEVIIRSLAELKVGDPVVHEDHGVGRYLGLQTLDVGDGLMEFLALEYAGKDKLYIPVVALHLIGRYTGTDPENAPLHRLGSEAWEKARRKAQKKAYDAAAELLAIQAEREARKGTIFKIDEKDYAAFVDSFPFEETPDQDRAITEVLQDMRTDKVMDRLICGDVGFGKTEVAMRAAFVAVNSQQQVIVLVPTTLLAQQHHQNFKDRFADWPVRVELLSRFRTKKEQLDVIKDLANGKVDIVIGTHRLLQDDIKFKQLGLLIIDEEHRFGVRQKEKLKRLRSEVDILTLTATPIPRTLNMGLAGLRDISIIATAPEERLSIKTFVYENNNSIIREACLREIRRGGQVYFLHNEVRTMEKRLRELEELLPEAEIHMAHGQMPERELERVMLDFYHQRFNILLCSTIIESGIDVPTANTMIIERADKFGLGQLHQLRGRVGRSHHRAYAYLFIPSRGAITAEASKRLDAIAALEDLGAGFTLAAHDLEIRGAGELLGESQSGMIDEVGFSLYSELLERAVKSIKAGESLGDSISLQSDTEINIHAPALLPEDYLADVHMRLILYKRIANAKEKSALKELKEEIIDRFGLLPEETKRLFKVTELKILASRLSIQKIDAGPKGARIDFHAKLNLDPSVIIQLVQTTPNVYKLDGPNRLRIIQDMPEPEDRIKMLGVVLEMLSASLH